MSAPPPVIVTLDEVRATARDIVNHDGTRRAIGVSVHHVLAMAHTVCALDDIAKAAAELIKEAGRHRAASVSGDIDVEVSALEDMAGNEATLADALMALGFLSPEQETTDASAQ